MVNDALIFRFAKVPDAIETLEKEMSLLCFLQNRITLPIPNPTYVCLDAKNIGEVFVGYPRIPGIPLWRKNFHKITDDGTKQHLAKQLARFLKELHQIPVDELPVDLPIKDTPQYWMKMYTQIKEKLYPAMRPDARAAVTVHFEDFFTQSPNHEFQPRLRHGDFGTGNLLFDPDSQCITGVIDFGGVGLGDPATDFAGMYISFGEAFYRHAYTVYPEMEPALERVKFFIGTFALEEALFGFDNNDQDAYQAGMKNYI